MAAHEHDDVDGTWDADTAPEAPNRAARRHPKRAIGGAIAAAKMTPEQRTERARKGGLALAAIHAAEKAARGDTTPPKTDYYRKRQPSWEAIAPYYEELVKDPAYRDATERDLRRQATVLLKADLVRASFGSDGNA